MLTEERLRAITDYINKNKSATVVELTKLLNISQSTVRRDLVTLDRIQKIKKVHGGATSNEAFNENIEYDISVRNDMNADEKERIGKYCAKLIKPNDFVFVDSGTTTFKMIDFITETNAIYVTNGTVNAQKLTSKGLKTIILGGEVKSVTQAIVGVEAIRSIERYNFNIGFFGTNGVDNSKGFTTPDINEALIKEKALEKCKYKYILCDNSKFGKIYSVTFGKITSGKIITTLTDNIKIKAKADIVEVDNL